MKTQMKPRSTTATQTATTDFKISSEAYEVIQDFIGSHLAERGAMLGADPDGVIRHVICDTEAACGAAEYSPSVDLLNREIKNWKKQGIDFVGFAHSHPRGIRHPSYADEEYSVRILQSFSDLELLWLPIVQTKPNTGQFELLPYAAVPNAKRNRVQIESRVLSIVDMAENDTHLYGDFAIQSHLAQSSRIGYRLSKKLQAAQKRYHTHFERMANDFDLKKLNSTRLIIIGTGGAASFIKSCARMGFGEFVLIDPDTVSASNIATQDVMPKDIGKAKVVALAEQVVEINPLAVVCALNVGVESLSDDELFKLSKEPIKYAVPANLVAGYLHQPQPQAPSQSIILVLTDSFEAQARGHRLGLNMALPTICAQQYAHGAGAEITFTVPDVHDACHRCITASRYTHYLNGGTNTVTSAGSPIFAADYLNASLGHVLLAVAHHGSNHPVWSGVIHQLGNRNLAILKMNPSLFAETVGVDLVQNKAIGAADAEAFLMLNTIFLPQTADAGQSPERPVCPDCLGKGASTALKGSFSNTLESRLITPVITATVRADALSKSNDENATHVV